MKKIILTLMTLTSLSSCGDYLNSLKKEKANQKPDENTTLSEIRNIDNVKDDGAKICYEGATLANEALKKVARLGRHEVNISQADLEELRYLFGDLTPKLEDFSTIIIPNIDDVLNSNGINTPDIVDNLPIHDWQFGAAAIGQYIFFVQDNPSVIPFYTTKIGNKLGVEIPKPTERQRARFMSLLAHELTHVIQFTQPKAREKIQKSCVIQNDIQKSERYDYTISGVTDVFKLGNEASAEFIENTTVLGLGFSSSSHDLDQGTKSIVDNFIEHKEIVQNSTGF